jgi:hypothetical protein
MTVTNRSEKKLFISKKKMSASLYPWLKERDEKRKKKLFKIDVLVRVEETVLGVPFNVQSQVTDIPGVSLYTSSSRYAVSLQTQSLTVL